MFCQIHVGHDHGSQLRVQLGVVRLVGDRSCVLVLVESRNAEVVAVLVYESVFQSCVITIANLVLRARVACTVVGCRI